MSPTARSLALLRKDGWIAEVVERYNSFSRKRTDFIGVIDILSFKPSEKGALGIQATSDGNGTARISKAMQEPKLKAWLQSGGLFQVWSWGKHGKRGKRKTYKRSRWSVELCGEDKIGWRKLDD